jgi:cysteinyl-tRNA synthetase
MLRLYNTLSGRVEAFEPSGSVVKFFTCGPTVYARAHLGHGKSYVTADLVRRMLAFEGMEVRHVMNYTDVSDETARKAAVEGAPELDISVRCGKAFERDMEVLNVLAPHARPRVSEHVREIVAIVEELVGAGKAYVNPRGVYLRVKHDDHGTLMHNPLEVAVVPGDVAEKGGKEDALDFALWEPAPDGRLSWESPWGKGRPGWHVQDFSFLDKLLGFPVDIYSGGVDLIFPHHESEIIMARVARGRPAARFFVHNGHVTFEGDKLSKSKGVRVELKDLYKRWGGETTRFFLVQSHYREQTPYTEGLMATAAERFARLKGAWEKAEAGANEREPQTGSRQAAIWKRIVEAMENDLRTDVAVAELESLARLQERTPSPGAPTHAQSQSPAAASQERGEAAGPEDMASSLWVWRRASKLLGLLADYPAELRTDPKLDDCRC